ncbi:MAG: TolC family protein [Phycisphaerales bacterium]|nr:MAG: TolC family protein [Phycisphaerales bacterium]
MSRKHRMIGLCVLSGASLAGCATVDPRPDYAQLGRQVTQATGQERVYQPGDNDLIPGLVEELLDEGITASEAAQICLLNNPTLQAALMDIGMARADVVQSGLLSNPSLGISVRFPSGGGLATLESGLAQNISDLWHIPLRKRIAERSLDRAILQAAQQAANLAMDAKVTYFEAIGADEQHRIAQENLTITRSLLEMTLTRQQAGAANELEVNLSRSLALEAELSAGSARLEASEARRRLATILGITADGDELALLDKLPEVPLQSFDVERITNVAWAQRLDIRAARQTVSMAEADLREQYRSSFPAVELGFELERGGRERSHSQDILADTVQTSIAEGAPTLPEIESWSQEDEHTDFSIGPSLDIELPIFDQNQAGIARASYAYKQARKTLEALDRAVVQEVRGAVDRTLTAWRLAQIYRDRSIPLAQRNLDLSREAYRAGRASFLSVLEAERFFLDSRSQYVAAATTAATTIPELERTTGATIAALVAEAAATPAANPAVEQSEEKVEP